MSRYQGWWDVPAHVMSATALAALEFPRAPTSRPHTVLEVWENWRGKKDSVSLYDARECPPTKSTGAQLAAAAAKSARVRVCADCGARCQRPLPPLIEALPNSLNRDRRQPGPGDEVVDAAIGDPHRAVCPACRSVALLRGRQAQLAAGRPACAARAHELLTWAPAAALVQAELTVPPPTPSGRRKPATAVRVRAAGLDGKRLLDVTVRLAGPRAQHIPAGALAPEEARPRLAAALDGRRLISWSLDELTALGQVFPVPHSWDYARPVWGHDNPAVHAELPGAVRAAVIEHLAAQWRGQLELRTRTLIECIAPGSPDRLLLLLQRIAATL